MSFWKKLIGDEPPSLVIPVSTPEPEPPPKPKVDLEAIIVEPDPVSEISEPASEISTPVSEPFRDEHIEDIFPEAIPEPPPVEEKKPIGRPRKHHVSLLTDEQIAKIRRNEEKNQADQDRRKKKALEKKAIQLEKRRLEAQRKVEVAVQATEYALSAPIPEPVTSAPLVKNDGQFKPGISPNPDGSAKPVRDAIRKCIVLARASADNPDKSRLDALLDKIYLMAMQAEDLDSVLDAAKFIAERLEGKAGVEGEGGGSSAPSLVVNIGTRFGKADQPVVEVLEAKESNG
jgi:hypothetical protein